MARPAVRQSGVPEEPVVLGVRPDPEPAQIGPILDRRPVPVSDEHRARILQPEDVAEAVVMIASLPPRAHVSELIIKPVTQDFA